MDTTELTALIYTRKSSEKGDNNTSLSTQVKYCLNLADQIGASVEDDHVFQENYSGMKLNRPELNQVMRLLRDRKANTLIVYSPDRLTRVPYDGASLRNEFKRLGVRLFIVTRGEVEYSGIYESFNYMQDAASEQWRNSLVEATNRGKKAVIDAGVWLGIGRMKYGYQRIGSKLQAQVIHVENEKQIILRIFDHFVNRRYAPTEIADMLNAAGIPTRSERRKGYNSTLGKWRPENIYNILKDEAYIGIFYANKWNQDGSLKPKDGWIPIEVPPIIDRYTFDKAQELLADGRSRNARRCDHNYLIGRLVYCADCGYKMIGKPNSTTSNSGNGKVTYRYYNYRCSANTSRFNGKVCSNTQYKAEVVDCVVWNWIVELINNPRAIITAYRQAQTEIDNNLQDTVALVDSYQKSLDNYNRQLSDMADLYAERLITKDIFKEKKLLLDKSIMETEQRLREARELLDSKRITDADIDHIEDFTNAVRNRLAAGEDISFEEKRQLVEDLHMHFKLVRINGVKHVVIYWAIYEQELPIGRYCDSVLPISETAGANSKCILRFDIRL